MRNSQKCFRISKLAGEVLVDYGIPMTSRFIPQVVRLQKEIVTSSLLPPSRVRRMLSLYYTSSGTKRVLNKGLM